MAKSGNRKYWVQYDYLGTKDGRTSWLTAKFSLDADSLKQAKTELKEWKKKWNNGWCRRNFKLLKKGKR